MLLGVDDDGCVEGISDRSIDNQIKTLVRDTNNAQILFPTYYFAPQVIEVEEGKKIIVLYVPESSQVHKYKNQFFDRSNEGDLNITQNAKSVSELYLRKQISYSENRIYPFLTMSDLDQSLFDRVRQMVRIQSSNHPWLGLSNDELLRSAGLQKRDFETGEQGYTLAAAFLFGKQDTIAAILPHYKTDCICRIINTDRYDDREDIRENLIIAYGRIFDFVRKHLPDPFYLEGEQRISLREIIFREVIANLLVHREFTHAYPAKLIISAEVVETENWNKPHLHGLISIRNMEPFPKNPTLARFFKELGWVEELGSGVRNIFKYCPIFSKGHYPVIVEEEIFRVKVPYNVIAHDLSPDLSPDLLPNALNVLKFCQVARSNKEIMEHLGLKPIHKNLERYVKPLLNKGLLQLTVPEKVNSRFQKYLTTEKGKRLLM